MTYRAELTGRIAGLIGWPLLTVVAYFAKSSFPSTEIWIAAIVLLSLTSILMFHDVYKRGL